MNCLSISGHIHAQVPLAPNTPRFAAVMGGLVRIAQVWRHVTGPSVPAKAEAHRSPSFQSKFMQERHAEAGRPHAGEKGLGNATQWMVCSITTVGWPP